MTMSQPNQKIKRNRTTVVCVHKEKILGFWGEDPHSKERIFILPGGELELNETPENCAMRETLEETGYRVRVDLESVVLASYDFNWNGRIYACHTHFFRAYLEDPLAHPNKVSDASYHRGVEWIEVSKIEDLLSYHEVVKEAVITVLRQANNGRNASN